MKNILILSLILLLPAGSLFGQGKKERSLAAQFDRLISRYHSLPDSTGFEERLGILLDADSLSHSLPGKSEDKMKLYQELIDLYSRRRDKEGCTKYSYERLNVAKQFYPRNDTSLIRIYTEAGVLLGRMGDFRGGSAVLEEGMRLVDSDKTLSDDYYRHRSILLEYNRIILNQTEFYKADSIADLILDLDRRLHSEASIEYAEDLNYKAIVAWYLNNPAEATRYFNLSKEIFERVDGGDRSPSYIRLLSDLGNVYAHQNRLTDSRDILLLRYQILQSLPGTDPFQLATGQLDYAKSLYGLKQIDEALPHFIEINKLFNSVPKDRYSRNNWRCLFYLADCYRLKGETEKAEQYMLERIDIAKEIPQVVNKRDLAMQNLGFGHFLLALDRYREARPYLEACLRLDSAIVGKSHIDYIDHAQYLCHLEYMDNKDSCRAAYMMFDSSSVSYARIIKEACYYMTSDGLENFVRALDKNQDFMCSILERNPDLHNADKCQDLLLFSKGFVLNALDRTKNVALNNEQTAVVFARLKEEQSLLAAEMSKPEQMRKNTEQLKQNVRDTETELAFRTAALRYSMKQVRTEEIRQVLNDDEACVEFVSYRYKANLKDSNNSLSYAALIVRKNAPTAIFVPLCRKSALDSLIRISGKSPFELANAIYGKESFGKLLWGPILPHLEGVNHLYIAPDLDLHKYNMGAMLIRNKITVSDRYRITLLNSARDIILLKSQAPSFFSGDSQRALIIGDIDYNTADQPADETAASDTVRGLMDFAMTDPSQRTAPWTKIPYSKNEIDTISSKLRKNQFTIELLTGIQANEARVKKFDYKNQEQHSPELMHFSTHGYFFTPALGKDPQISGDPAFKASGHPMIRSGLLLSGANAAWLGRQDQKQAEDGILTAWEVSQLNLDNTRLAVLSACETGLGDINNAEGVYGLRRAFKIAGVDKVVMSLWKVPDFQTQELMTAFYENLIDRRIDAARSLYEAQKTLRRKKYEPYYWAGFVIVE